METITKLFDAIREGSVSLITKFLEENPIDLADDTNTEPNDDPRYNSTALKLNLRRLRNQHNKLKITKLLIKHQIKIGKDPAILINKGNPRPINCTSSVNILRYLLKHGLDLQFYSEDECLDRSAIGCACFGFTKQHINFLKALVKYGARKDFYFPSCEYGIYNEKHFNNYKDDMHMIKHFIQRKSGYFEIMKYLIEEHNYGNNVEEDGMLGQMDHATMDLIYNNLEPKVKALKLPEDIERIIKRFLGIDKFEGTRNRKFYNFEQRFYNYYWKRYYEINGYGSDEET